MSMICLFLSLLISFGLKYILSYIKIGPLACLLGIFAWNIFFHPLTRGDVYLWNCGDVSQSWCESMLLRCSRSSVSYPTVKSVPWGCREGWIETLIFRISVSSGYVFLNPCYSNVPVYFIFLIFSSAHLLKFILVFCWVWLNSLSWNFSSTFLGRFGLIYRYCSNMVLL